MTFQRKGMIICLTECNIITINSIVFLHLFNSIVNKWSGSGLALTTLNNPCPVDWLHYWS